jgi:hypothetical protein
MLKNILVEEPMSNASTKYKDVAMLLKVSISF